MPALSWSDEPFQKRPWHVRLEDTISDALYRFAGDQGSNFELPMPGALRFENAQIGTGPYTNVYCHGVCWFRWGCNRSGSAISRGQIARLAANQAVTADAAGTVSTFTDTAQFTAYEEIGNMFYCLDDAGGAGAAPEGEQGVIVNNDANTLYIQPNMTAATAIGDTGVIVSVGKLDLLGAALERRETFGVALASSVADNYWGWFLCYGWVRAYIKAATIITQGIGLIGDTGGRLTVSSTSGQDIMLARAEVNCSNDIVSDMIPVFFDVLWGTPFTTA